MSTEQKPAKHEPDWAAIDALTDDDIDRQIAADPDAAPEMGDVPLDRWTAYQPLDVKAIRQKSGMTQQQFSKTYELSLGALRDWEQHRRMPHGPARVLLKVIDREPEAVSRALRPAVGRGGK